MLYYDTYTDDNSHLIIWKATEDLKETSKTAKCDNDTTYLKLSPKRQKEWAFVRLLLKQEIPTATIIYNEKGKPAIKDSSIKISISHTKEFIAIMTNKDGKEIGFDIETRQKRTALNVSDKFITNLEKTQCPTDDELTNALIYWTSKEALYKICNDKEVDYKADYEIEQIKFAKEEGESIIRNNRNGIKYRLKHKIFDDIVLSYTNGKIED